MTTKETVERYFGALRQKQGWETLLADNMAFTSYVSPVKQVNGRDAYLQATKRFFSMIVSVDVRELIVEGDRVCPDSLRAPAAERGSGVRKRCGRIFLGCRRQDRFTGDLLRFGAVSQVVERHDASSETQWV